MSGQHQSPPHAVALQIMQRFMAEMDMDNEEDTCWEDLLLATTKTDGQRDSISWTTIATSYIVAAMGLIAAILLWVQVYKATQKDKALKQQQAALKKMNRNQNNIDKNINSHINHTNSMNTKMIFDDINGSGGSSYNSKQQQQQTSDVFNPNDMMKNTMLHVEGTATADEEDEESTFPHLIASLEDLENYDEHDPLARNWQMVYFCQVRRKALSWYMIFLAMAYLLDAVRHQSIHLGIGSNGQEWLIRASFLLVMIAFPGVVIGVLSNRVLSGIDEQQGGEPQKMTQPQRATQQKCHGSAMAGILAVFTAVAIVIFLLPLDDASWVFGFVWLAWTGLLLALTLLTSGCICTDGFVFGEVDIVPVPTSLTAVSSLLFSLGQFLMVSAFCLDAILTPICAWSHDPANQDSTTTTTTASAATDPNSDSELSYIMSTNCFASTSCPLPESFPPTALANLIVYMALGVILVGGLLLPKP